MTPEQIAAMQERIKQLEAQVAAANTKTINVSFKTSTKSGAMICYGLQRFPVTLHEKQWQFILDNPAKFKQALADHVAGKLPKHTPVEREN
jgi:hypothetical protein